MPRGFFIGLINREKLYVDESAKILVPNLLVRMLRNPLGIEILNEFFSNLYLFFCMPSWNNTRHHSVYLDAKIVKFSIKFTIRFFT